jgi:hypothetical protein
MESFALLTVCKVWKSFNPEKSNNPFAYFTQVLRHAFYQYLNHEKKQREVKDELLIDMGEQASFTYMEKYRDEMLGTEYEGMSTDDEELEDDEVEVGRHRPGYESTLPGLVTEINYAFGEPEELPVTNDEREKEL